MHQPPHRRHASDRRPPSTYRRGRSSAGGPPPSAAQRSTAQPSSARPSTAAPSTAAPSAAAPSAAQPVLRRRRPVAGRAIVALASVVVLAVTGFSWNSLTSLQNRVTTLGGLSLGSGRDGAVDILMVGTDSRTDAQGTPLTPAQQAALHAGDEVATNTDTIMLIRVPNDGSSATAISIPRDAYVDVPGVGKSKINAAFGATKEATRESLVEKGTDPATAEKDGTQAGRKALIQTVAQLTGVQVDHYAEVGLLGFVLLTDAVGGVDVCLRNPVDEPLSGARFPAGRQTLDGTRALSFVRQRHDLPRGDLDRIVRQQVFMASLAQRVLSAGTLTDPRKLSRLETAVTKSVTIDDSWDIVQFISQLKDLTGGKVRFATIPVADDQGWSDDGTQSVVTVDPAAVHRFTTSLLSPPSNRYQRGNYTVDVLNAGSVDGLAANVSAITTKDGFAPGTTGNPESAAGSTDGPSAVLTSEKSAGADDLAKRMGGLPVRVDSSVPSGHLRLVLTDSYTGPGSIADTGARSDTAATPAAAAATSTTPPPITAAGSGPKCVN